MTAERAGCRPRCPGAHGDFRCATRKSRRITVGRHGVVSADQARRKSAQMIARIKAGEDPEPPVVKSADAPTVSDLARRYLVEHVEVRCKPRTIASGR